MIFARAHPIPGNWGKQRKRTTGKRRRAVACKAADQGRGVRLLGRIAVLVDKLWARAVRQLLLQRLYDFEQGLQIVLDIAHWPPARIWIKSKPTRVLIFHFSGPWRNRPAAKSAMSKQHSPSQSATPQKRDCRIGGKNGGHERASGASTADGHECRGFGSSRNSGRARRFSEPAQSDHENVLVGRPAVLFQCDPMVERN